MVSRLLIRLLLACALLYPVARSEAARRPSRAAEGQRAHGHGQRRPKAAPEAGVPTLSRATVPELHGGADCDDLGAALLAEGIERELPILQEMQAGYRFGGKLVTPAEYATGTLMPLLSLARKGPAALCQELPRRFWFYRPVKGGRGPEPAHFTAYNHPEFHGSRQRGGRYQHPLYRRPRDERASLTTAEILRGGLDGLGLELVYLDDATAALTAHIEGSAHVVLDDGTEVNVTTDGHNGGVYQNVAKLVLRDKKIPRDQVTPPGMSRVRQYFIDHPDELLVYWAQNPHYVYFKETPLAGTGRFGELVPGRSLAVDLRHVPLGAAVWMLSEKPVVGADQAVTYAPLRRVGLAQDTGAAIQGPERVDIFFGSGDYAQRASTMMNKPGRLYVLLGKPAARSKPGKAPKARVARR